jgi:hypothetical protein
LEKVAEIHIVEEKLFSLREKINKDIVKYIENRSTEGYNKLLSMSKDLDEVIVSYIRISEKKFLSQV